MSYVCQGFSNFSVSRFLITFRYEKTFRDLGSRMNTALIIIGLAMFIFIVVFSLKRAKEKTKAQQEEHEKIKEYGESINEETRNKYK